MRLNVIFHGFFVFLRRGDYVDALIPDLGDAHKYIAGRWLRETPIIRRNLELIVPRRGSDRLDPKENLLFVGVGRNIARQHARAIVRVPLPDRIKSLGKLEPKKGCKVESPLLHRDFRRFATTQVFRYSFSDIRKLELRGHDWCPERDGPGLVNLHLYAEPPRKAPAGHLRHMVHALNSLLPNLRLRVDDCLKHVATNEPAPRGVIPAELQPLDTRIEFVVRKLRKHHSAKIRAPLGTPPTCWNAGDDEG